MTPPQFLECFNAEFIDWFKDHVIELHQTGSVSQDIFYLALGSLLSYKRYQAFDVNGFRFRTLARDVSRTTQCNGVLCIGDNTSDDKEYYGVLESVWEIQYTQAHVVHLFKCLWYDVNSQGSGIKVDEYGITSLNLNRRLQTDEPFILACQAQQVFYVSDPKHNGWVVAMRVQPRDLYSMPLPSNDENGDASFETNDEAYQEEDYDVHGRASMPLDERDVIHPLHREDVEPEKEPLEVGMEIEHRIWQETLEGNDYVDADDIPNNDEEYESDHNDCESLTSDDD